MAKKKTKKNMVFSSYRLNDAISKSDMNNREISLSTGISLLRLDMLRRGDAHATAEEANLLGTVLRVNPEWIITESCKMNIPPSQRSAFELKRDELVAKIVPEEHPILESVLSPDSKNVNIEVPFMRMDVIVICSKGAKSDIEHIIGQRIPPGQGKYTLTKKTVNKLAKASGISTDWISGKSDTTDNQYIDFIHKLMVDCPDFANKAVSIKYSDQKRQKERLSCLIRDERLRKSITNKEIADEIGITENMLSSYMNNRVEMIQRMPFISAARIGMYLGEDPRYIMGMITREESDFYRYTKTKKAEPEEKKDPMPIITEAEPDEADDIKELLTETKTGEFVKNFPIYVGGNKQPEEKSASEEKLIDIEMTRERADIYNKYAGTSEYVKSMMKKLISNSSIEAEEKITVNVPKEDYYIAHLIANTKEDDVKRIRKAVDDMISIENSFGEVTI